MVLMGSKLITIGHNLKSWFWWFWEDLINLSAEDDTFSLEKKHIKVIINSLYIMA